MQPLLISQQVRDIDTLAEQKYRIPPLVLMENVATNATNKITEYFTNNSIAPENVAVFCGTGNNGGDGMCVARHLSADYNVTVFAIGKLDKFTPATLANFNILTELEHVNISYIKKINDIDNIKFDFDVIIDAIIGVGFNGTLKPLQQHLIQALNQASGVKIAIDIPSGLNSDKGFLTTDNIENADNYPIFKADTTITMLAPKIGMYLHAKHYNPCGNIEIAPLATGQKHIPANHFLLEKSDVKRLIVPRKPDSHKYNYGKVLVIAGSKDMAGTTALCSNAAMKMGAGLTYIISHAYHSSIMPEVIKKTLPSVGDYFTELDTEILQSAVDLDADAIALGPGIGTKAETMNVIKKIVLSNLNKYWVIDADAITAFNTNDILNKNILITPHTGEFLRLLNKNKKENNWLNYKELENNKIDILMATAKQMNCNILLKGTTTIITDGTTCYWNSYGNPGMATAGSGDVLAGIIATNIGKIIHYNPNNISTLETVAISSLIHSLAGDFYAEHNDMETLTASDIINCITHIVKQWY